MKPSWITVLLLLLSGLPAWGEEAPGAPSEESAEATGGEEAPPVGGLFGLLRGRQAAKSVPQAAPAVAPAPESVPTPAVEPRATPRAEASPPSVVEPLPTPQASEAPAEETAKPAPAEEGEELPAPKPPAAKATGKLPPPVAAQGRGGKADVELPPAEIQGEIEKPDIFFLVPRAKDQSDEQMIRARIKREITRPVIKDWVEEEMLLK